MDSTSNTAGSAAAAGVFGVFIVFYMAFVLALVAFSIWMYWRIFTRAGFNGALSLLNLVPGIGYFVCVVILAFGRWPIEDALAASGGRLIPAGASPPGSTLAPPGA
jgi:hypothetical protein